MGYNKTQLPVQFQKGPAVGFLILTEYLAEFRLEDTRSTVDWQRMESLLRQLRNSLNELLSLEDLDKEFALEIVIHRDRVCHVLHSWQEGYINRLERAFIVKQECHVRQLQRNTRVR